MLYFSLLCVFLIITVFGSVKYTSLVKVLKNIALAFREHFIRNSFFLEELLLSYFKNTRKYGGLNLFNIPERSEIEHFHLSKRDDKAKP